MTNDDLCQRVVATAHAAIGDALAENAAILVFAELVRDEIRRGGVPNEAGYGEFARTAWGAGRAFAKARGER